MKNIFVIIYGLIILAFCMFVAYVAGLATPQYTVVNATRIDGATYQVGLEDREGLYFSLELDLVKFSALGIDVDDILAYGEE